MDKELLLNNFAIRAFRDTADRDYIHARMAYKGKLIQQFLWSGLQAIEKYLKCIHLLNRQDTRSFNHNLIKSLSTLEINVPFPIRLHARSRKLIEHLNKYGKDRYLINSYYIEGFELQELDMAVWQLRRYCMLFEGTKELDKLSLQKLIVKKIAESESQPPQKYKIESGVIEDILADRNNPSRRSLVWNNLFFGVRARKVIKFTPFMQATNSPLFMHPEMLDVLKSYVKT